MGTVVAFLAFSLTLERTNITNKKIQLKKNYVEMKKGRIVLLLAASLMFTGVASAQTADDVINKFNEAAALLNAKNYAEAVPVLEQTVELATASTDEGVAETLAETQKQLANAYLNWGRTLASGGDMDNALPKFEKALELAESYNPANVAVAKRMIVTVYNIQGGQQVNAGNYAGAAEIYAKALTVDPNNGEIGLLAAQCYAQAGDLAKAGEIYEKLVAAGNAKAKEAYAIDLLSTAVKAENFEDANAALQKIFSFDPTNAQALLAYIQTANNYKKYDEVIAKAEEAAAAQTDEAKKSDIYFLQAIAYQTKEDKANAIAAYKKVTAGDNAATAKTQIEALSK